MAENARTGFVWEHFMKNDIAKNGMARAGFHELDSVRRKRAVRRRNPHLPNGYPLWDHTN